MKGAQGFDGSTDVDADVRAVDERVVPAVEEAISTPDEVLNGPVRSMVNARVETIAKARIGSPEFKRRIESILRDLTFVPVQRVIDCQSVACVDCQS